MGFAERLRELRGRAGLAQGQLAEQASIPVDSIQNWEQGRTKPRLEALAKLARALGASLDDLVAPGDGEPPGLKKPRGRPRKGLPGESRETKKPRDKRKEK
jgi:transcriptional regulator with XRE-family HTH domain